MSSAAVALVVAAVTQYAFGERRSARVVRLLAWLVALALLTAVGLGDGAAATPPAGLLARFAPVLVLHPAERFAPVPVEGFIADSDFLVQAPDGTWQPSAEPFPGSASTSRLDQRSCRAIEGTAAIDCYAQAQAAHDAGPTAYGAVFRSKGRIALQYWLFYPYNLWSQTTTAGTVTQAHEGDWEQVTVLLDAKEKPVLVGLSRHCAGVRRPWSKAPRQGTHPLVHVALGSHANGFTTGTTPQEMRCWPEAARAILKAYGLTTLVDVAAPGARLRPRIVRVSSSTPAWMTFRGTWGETQYVTFPGNDPFGSGAGPRSPAFQKPWRAPFATPLSWPLG